LNRLLASKRIAAKSYGADGAQPCHAAKRYGAYGAQLYHAAKRYGAYGAQLYHAATRSVGRNTTQAH